MKAIDIVCPSCGAPAGKLCVRRLKSGKETPADYLHASRLKAALQTLKPGSREVVGVGVSGNTRTLVRGRGRRS